MTLSKKGFTLVELLVVIAIIGMLMSLLLPAVQQAREAGRRTVCGNQVRQLALACLTNEQIFKVLPSGGYNWEWTGDPDRGLTKNQPGSWAYAVLPNMEQESLFMLGSDRDDLTLSSTQQAAATEACKTVPPGMICPSRRGSNAYPAGGACTFKNCNIRAGDMICKTDYAANTGTVGNNHTATSLPASWSDMLSRDKSDNWPDQGYNGVIYHRSTVTEAQIRDGMSNTYLLGEKYLVPANYENGQDAADNESIFHGHNNDTHRLTSIAPSNDRVGYVNTTGFGSVHLGIFCMALCSGSTHWVAVNIDPEVHKALGTRAGAELLDNPFE